MRKRNRAAMAALIGTAAVLAMAVYAAWPMLGGSPSAAGRNSSVAGTGSGVAAGAAGTDLKEQFDLSNLQVDRDRLLSGGPPKDGIPALVEPATVPAAKADFLEENDRVVGVEIAGRARAYPLRLLNWHEIVNDRLGGLPIAVVYCPLCDSAGVVERRIDGQVLQFGVSGLLLNSNVLLYDRTSDALWSQVGLEAISGPHAGAALEHLPFELTSFGSWRRRHPDGTVATFETGHGRNYEFDPYAGYFENDRLMFPVNPLDDRLPPKTRVVGVRIDGKAKAYTLEAIAAAPDGRLTDEIAGHRLAIASDGTGFRVLKMPSGAEVVQTFWFAWAAFHPGTELIATPGA